MMKITSYKVIDGIKRVQVGSDYSVKNRNRARARAEKLNQEYGSYRYRAQPVMVEEFI